MCGIVAACAERDVAPILLEGLRRLEYRGYDSAGIAVLDAKQQLQRLRRKGKVAGLEQSYQESALLGHTGIAHTRWATHGEPCEKNAHPHMSDATIAVVHNGIIENYQQLKVSLLEQGYDFHTDTDTEIVAHLIDLHLTKTHDFLMAVRTAVAQLEGAYGLAVLHTGEERVLGVRSHSPLVVGIGIGENFLASDPLALLPVTQTFIYLEEGDIVDLYRDRFVIYDAKGVQVERDIHYVDTHNDAVDRGTYRHYMQKEIYEQPHAVQATLEGRLGKNHILEQAFGDKAAAYFDQVKQVHIVACGTSYHAGMVARYWLESLAGVHCQVEVASEYRYRDVVVSEQTLFVTLSQSGETADTLAALRKAKQHGHYVAHLAICNVSASSLARESDLVLMTQAGREIGVASTKAFTTQLVVLFMLTAIIGRRHALSAEQEEKMVQQLNALPAQMTAVLKMDAAIEQLAQRFADKQHALFLGRGALFPIALEGSLKLKEISYIHAEAYPAGELKHGPLALVDKDMPVIAVAPNNELLEKLISNLHEVKARGGELIIFADEHSTLRHDKNDAVLILPNVDAVVAPIIYTLPLQLLSYHVAVLKGTDVDQPRNLAKSVTVE